MFTLFRHSCNNIVYIFILFKCFKFQSLSSFLVLDMELQFIVDYDVDDIEYRPINIPNQIKESLESVAPYMKENLYFSSENAPKLLKTLLDVIES